MDDDLRARFERLEKEFAESTARYFGMREVVARMLAYVAGREPDVDAALRNISEGADTRTDRIPVTHPILLGLTEGMRREQDWLVQAALEILRTPPGSGPSRP